MSTVLMGESSRRGANEDFVGPEDIRQTIENWLADAALWSRT
jgi:hypothetical protein